MICTVLGPFSCPPLTCALWLCSGRGPPSPWSWISVLPTGSSDTSCSRFTTILWPTRRNSTTMSPSLPRCMGRPPSTWCLRSLMRWKWWKTIPLLTLAVVRQLVFVEKLVQCCCWFFCFFFPAQCWTLFCCSCRCWTGGAAGCSSNQL